MPQLPRSPAYRSISAWARETGLRFEDIIEESGDQKLKEISAEFGFGVYVVRNAVQRDVLEFLERELPRALHELERTADGTWKPSRIGVGAKPSAPLYTTFQAVENSCACAYKYESTAQHPVEKFSPNCTSRPGAICQKVLDEVWSGMGLGSYWNLFVVNRYQYRQNQSIGWHDDTYPLMDNPRRMQNYEVGNAKPPCDRSIVS